MRVNVRMECIAPEAEWNVQYVRSIKRRCNVILVNLMEKLFIPILSG